MASTGAPVAQLSTRTIGPVMPVGKMESPRFPPRLNLMGIAWPELAELTVGRLSTGCRNPVNGHTTANDLDTGVAGAYVELPAWLAVTVHVPMFTRVTVLPDTVHTVDGDAAYETGRPDDAVAPGLNVVPMFFWVGCVNVMAWA